MTETTADLTQAEIERFAKLTLAIKRAQEELAPISEKIKARYTEPGTYVVGPVVIKRTKAVGVDKAAVEAAFPAAENPELYVPALNVKGLPKEIRDTFATVTERLSVDILKEA